MTFEGIVLGGNLNARNFHESEWQGGVRKR